MPTPNAVRVRGRGRAHRGATLPRPTRYPSGGDTHATKGGARVAEDEGEGRNLFTTAEAAAQFGIKQTAVKAAITLGTLKAVRINPRLNMVTAAAIEEYRREHLGRQGRPRGSRNGPKASPPAENPSAGREGDA